VQNLDTSVLNNVWREVKVDEQNEAYIVEKRRIKGSFKERQELYDFPFDFQVGCCFVCLFVCVFFVSVYFMY
jgi:hypothetical protein